ncbi:YdeI/OmpD-associated family protein [Gilvibacter sp.]|uniref:YdeI/OmpD-associated family protein n=1 Tax=Gilvibacter sp. TaxID=2729997 RepID=UPI0025BCB44F|nr:YdeI/OmpD-associated family protein [Gilvibacter sp.]NQX78261.1 YdeI/OmpD-associated family protein [Gilvibacter sp.]
MTDAEKIEAYLAKNNHWEQELTQLRSLLQQTEAVETVKWAIPSYTVGGKNVMGIGAFKNHFGLWFFNGSFLSDPKGVLGNAQEGKTRGMRQLNWNSVAEVDFDMVKAYAVEAIENQKQGKEIKPQRKTKALVVPIELQTAFDQDAGLKTAFDALTPGKQREYADHIGSAKQEKTRLSRLEKCRPMITAGAGLHDKYKNC